MKRRLALLLVALLSGCATIDKGPDASRVSLPSSFMYAPPQSSRDVLSGLLPDEDAAFRTLVAAVEKDAPDLQAAVARVAAARAALRAAGSARAPDVQASGSSGFARGSEKNLVNVPPGTPIDTSNAFYALGLNASWELDLFGRLKSSQRAAGLRLNAADADARAVRLAIVSDIARAVVDYRTAQAKGKIVDDDLADAIALVRLTRTRVRAGIAPGLDLVRAQSLEAASRAQAGPAEAERAGALGRLITLTARDGATIRSAFEQPGENRATPLPSVGLPSDLLRNRPDIAAAEYRLGAANADIATAAAARFPRININAALGLAALVLGDVFNADALTASLGSTVSAPLIDFGRTAAQIDARQADAQEAFALYRRAVFVGIGDAETALGTLRANSDRLSAIERQIAIEQDIVALSTARYRMGLSDFLGVIDAQRQLNAARQALADARSNVARSEIGVYRSFGG
jgi:NodT family efflux transporter outer membrane factor (OMF) lipoprotein